MLVRDAKEIAGTLSYPTKMPGTSFGLPAAACITGAKLAKVPGTPCSVCYALKDRYATANVAKAQQRRLAGLSHPRWVHAMVTMLLEKHMRPFFRIDLGIKNAKARGISRNGRGEAGWHRWHDSGDIQSVEHLGRICEVAERTPRIRHWLPTQELAMVERYIMDGGTIPANLLIRVSDSRIDGRARAWTHTSAVITTHDAQDGTHICPAPQNDMKCGSCRACWSPNVARVAYVQH